MKTTVLKGKIVHERYIIEELLGQGGFGAVYRVRDRRVQGNVFALKEVADPNRDQQENFLFEGEILRRLDHPALPRVYRVFEDLKTVAIVGVGLRSAQSTGNVYRKLEALARTGKLAQGVLFSLRGFTKTEP